MLFEMLFIFFTFFKEYENNSLKKWTLDVITYKNRQIVNY